MHRPLVAAIAGVALGALAAPACTGDDDPPPPDFAAVCSGLDDFVLAAWGSATDDMYFVGGSGLNDRALILHYDGERWLRTTGVSDRVLWWVWGSSSNDVWAVGEESEALHFRNGIWTRTCAVPSGCNPTLGTCAANAQLACMVHEDCPYVDRPTLYGVWGTAPDAVWAVGGSLGAGGPEDTIVFWNGDRWINGTLDQMSGQTLFKAWGAAADDIWAVGTNGVIYHYDGMSWALTPSPTEANLIGVYGTATDDVWAVGGFGSGVVVHWDGTAWTLSGALAAGTAGEPLGLNGVWTAPGANPVMVGHEGWAGVVRNGAMERFTTGVEQGLHAVFGDGSGLWAVGGNLLGGEGEGGVILHFGAAVPACEIDEFDQPLVPGMDCGTTTCPGGGNTAGPGDPCETGNDCECMGDLACWFIVRPLGLDGGLTEYTHHICSEECANDAQCTLAYGAGACCIVPGPQTVKRVCHRAGYTPVEGDPCMGP